MSFKEASVRNGELPEEDELVQQSLT